jgi:hypothetical protein
MAAFDRTTGWEAEAHAPAASRTSYGSGERTAARTPSVFLPRTGPSGTSARHATASDPVRMAFARSSVGGAFDVIPGLSPRHKVLDLKDKVRCRGCGERAPPCR